jgi:hypothetical protein
MLDHEATDLLAVPDSLHAAGTKMDPAEHTSIDRVRRRLRQVAKTSSVRACREGVGDVICSEVAAEHFDSSPGVGRQPARVVRIRRCGDV